MVQSKSDARGILRKEKRAVRMSPTNRDDKYPHTISELMEHFHQQEEEWNGSIALALL